MSHYLAVVLVSRLALDLVGEVGRLLAPYGHGGERGWQPCYCRGLAARREARRRAEEIAPLAELRMRYGVALRQRLLAERRGADASDGRKRALAGPELAVALRRELTAAHHALRAQVWAEHPARDQADPQCSACGGAGQYALAPRTPRWDEWVVGGRWYGVIAGQKIDPLLRLVSDDVLAGAENCAPASSLRFARWLPHALVTPDGAWFEGVAVEKLSRGRDVHPRWRAELEQRVERHRDAVAVACDLQLWS